MYLIKRIKHTHEKADGSIEAIKYGLKTNKENGKLDLGARLA